MLEKSSVRSMVISRLFSSISHVLQEIYMNIFLFLYMPGIYILKYKKKNLKEKFKEQQVTLVN